MYVDLFLIMMILLSNLFELMPIKQKLIDGNKLINHNITKISIENIPKQSNIEVHVARISLMIQRFRMSLYLVVLTQILPIILDGIPMVAMVVVVTELYMIWSSRTDCILIMIWLSYS
jgi:hypothetical protein